LQRKKLDKTKSSSGAEGDSQYGPTRPYLELLLFPKDQITPKQRSCNLQACPSLQNIQNPGISENTDEENGDDGEGDETAKPLPETYMEVTNEPPSTTGLAAHYQRKQPCSNASDINSKLLQLEECTLELLSKQSCTDTERSDDYEFTA
jgi:hypothetical protein